MHGLLLGGKFVPTQAMSGCEPQTGAQGGDSPVRCLQRECDLLIGVVGPSCSRARRMPVPRNSSSVCPSIVPLRGFALEIRRAEGRGVAMGLKDLTSVDSTGGSRIEGTTFNLKSPKKNWANTGHRIHSEKSPRQDQRLWWVLSQGLKRKK